jgi:hypothetical protein
VTIIARPRGYWYSTVLALVLALVLLGPREY